MNNEIEIAEESKPLLATIASGEWFANWSGYELTIGSVKLKTVLGIRGNVDMLIRVTFDTDHGTRVFQVVWP